jgi:hypothetical protein
MRIKTKVLVIGAVTAVLAGASGVAVAASSSAGSPTPPTAAKTAVQKPAGKFFDARTVALLAAQLRIPLRQAGTVADRLERIAARGRGIDPTSPEFVSIAKYAGTTPKKLAAALDGVKRAKG